MQKKLKGVIKMIENHQWITPEETRQELSKLLVHGLERALTQQEANTIYWLSECGIESRIVITNLIEELVGKVDD